MAENDIEISVDFDVGNEGTIDNATRALQQMRTAQEGVGAAQQTAARSASLFAAQQTAVATQAIQFTQRIAAAANAVQSLAAAFGGTGGNAGLIGRAAASAAAFAQLGSVLGPGGSLVGGIMGGAVVAFQHLSAAEDAARESANQLTASLDTLITRTEQAYGAQARLARLGRGGGTIAEQSAYLEQADQRRRLAESALGGDPGAIRELRRLGLTGRSDTDPGVMDVLRSALGGGAATQADESERAAIRRLADRYSRETQTRAELVETSIGAQTEQRTTSPRRRGGRPQEIMGQQRQFRVGQNEDVTQEIDATERLLALQEQQTTALREQREARDALTEAAQQQAEVEKQATQQAIDDSYRRKERETAEFERLQEQADQKKEIYQQQIESYQEVTGVLVSGLVKASEAIADGSASAEDAFKGLLGSFLQYISQRAALEAAAEFAQAIGAFASYNYASGAQHLAAGALWTGVAVATGVGGAALTKPSVPSGGPARPPSSSASQGERGGQTVVINYNSPVVTAQTEAGLGRTMRGIIGTSERRFPGASP